jgi:hypothetical protein
MGRCAQHRHHLEATFDIRAAQDGYSASKRFIRRHSAEASIFFMSAPASRIFWNREVPA